MIVFSFYMYNDIGFLKLRGFTVFRNATMQQ